VAATYTHYYSFFLIAGMSLFVLLHWRREWRLLARWLAALIVVGVAYIPWLAIQSRLLAGQAHARFDELSLAGLLKILKPTVAALAVGTTASAWYEPWIALGTVVLGGMGLAALLRRADSRPVGWLLLYCVIVPLALAWLTTPLMPFFFPRFLIVVSPAFLLLQSRGITAAYARLHLAAILVLLVLVLGNGHALANYYYSQDFWKGGYGHLIGYIEEHRQPGDAIVTINPDQRAIYDYYSLAGIPRYEFPMEFPIDDPRTEQALGEIADRHSRIWLILYGDATPYDPDGKVESWLGQHGAKSYHGDYVDAGLDLYSFGPGRPSAEVPVGKSFGNLIELVGYGVEPAAPTTGDTLLLHLHWRALSSIDRPYTVFTHLIDADDTVVAQMDGEPVGGTHPTTQWRKGEEVWDNFGLEIPSDTPDGTYCLEVGWYFLPTLERLGVDSIEGPESDRLLLCPILVSKD
jgi:hypothetical protein